MSWLLVVILIIAALSVLQGVRKGLLRTVVSTFFLIFVAVISIWLTPYVETVLREHTPLAGYIEENCSNFLEDEIEGLLTYGEGEAAGENGGDTAGTSGERADGADNPADSQGAFSLSDAGSDEQKEWIEQLPLPQYLKEQLQNNNTQEMYRELLADSFSAYITKYLSEVILRILSFLLSFVLAVILIQIILKVIDVMAEIPVLSLLNRIGGAAAGLVRALLWIWVFFAILTVFGNTGWGSACLKEISGTPLLDYLYTHNLILSVIFHMLGK